MDSRYLWIDNNKLFATILVVIGHSAFWNFSTSYGGLYLWDSDIHPCESYKWISRLISFIYTFHMPLFFSISGFLFGLTLGKHTSVKKYLKSKFHRLIIPFIVVTIFYCVPCMLWGGYFTNTNNVIRDVLMGEILLLGNNHLWYLMSLFGILTISITFLRDVNMNIIKWLTILFVSYIGYKLERNSLNLFGLATMMRYLIYFHFGRLIIPKLINIKISILAIISASIFLVSLFLFLGVLFSSYVFQVVYAICMLSITTILFKKVMVKTNNQVNYLSQNTYELYLYSCPLNYIIIKYAYDYFGTSVVTDDNIAIYMFMLRIIVQVLLSVILIEFVKVLKLKNIYKQWISQKNF